MDPRFNDIFSRPENSIFKVVFYPDRIYHSAYMNASRSSRYRYNVRAVRSKMDITVLKGEVYLDGLRYTNFVRIEYRSSRLIEASRERGRLGQDEMRAWVRFIPIDLSRVGEAEVKLHLCCWTDSYQAEFWETLETPPTVQHDFGVLDQMGRDAPITRVRSLVPALQDLRLLHQIEIAVRENDRELASGFKIQDPAWDNNYLSSHEEPRDSNPSTPANTVSDNNYLIDFQRGWFLDARQVQPVRYRNAMMDPDNPDIHEQNIIEMRWLLQREFGSSVVFFHEVTVPPGKVEGTHQHIGSEELYYVVEGTGTAYMAEGDDPATDAVDPATGQPIYQTVDRVVYGLGVRRCKALPVRPGSILLTKSGGVHGIRSDDEKPLRFVAFLYHSS